MLSITPGNIVASLTITEEDIYYILQSRGETIKNHNDYLAYMREHLPEALSAHLYDEVKYLTEAYIEREECPHWRTTTVTTGGYHYSAGEVWDDLKEVTVCLDCGKQLDDRETTHTEDATAEEVPF